MIGTMLVTRSLEIEMRDRILEMLGNGTPQVAVAMALGVSESYVSQLMDEPEFAREVAEKKFANLQKHIARDNKADDLEDLLLDKLKKSASMLVRPGEIAGVYKIVNQAKRRGALTAEQPVGQSQMVVLNMPVKLVQQFSTNIQKQVVEVGGQPMITIDPASLLKTVGGNTDDQKVLTEQVGS